jgi:uncharacterized membrane-anchored protein YhcB (DUF1043 family)
MDILTLCIGIGIGLIVGFVFAWVLKKPSSGANKSASKSTETELKGILAQQAKSHLDKSHDAIQTLETELRRLKASINEYEESLTVTNDDDVNSTFFGEHASMFLRNTESKSNNSSDTQSTEYQPKDFANSGSGVFVGSAAIEAGGKEK